MGLPPLARWLRHGPRSGYPTADAFLNTLSNEPRANAAVLHGLLAGPAAPPERERRQIDVPALVVGHRFDLLHPMDDAEAAARELPDGRLIKAWSILEARTTPGRLVGHIGDFLDQVWSPKLATSDTA